MTEFTYRIRDPEGLHALPAGDLVKLAESFSCSITLDHNGNTVDSKRVMHVMSLGVKWNDSITISCDGEDEVEAAAELKALCERII